MMGKLRCHHFLVARDSLIVSFGFGERVTKIVKRSNDTRVIKTKDLSLQIQRFTKAINGALKVLPFVLNAANITKSIGHMGHTSVPIIRSLNGGPVNLESILESNLR
jgi:hypothetical protein